MYEAELLASLFGLKLFVRHIPKFHPRQQSNPTVLQVFVFDICLTCPGYHAKLIFLIQTLGWETSIFYTVGTQGLWVFQFFLNQRKRSHKDGRFKKMHYKVTFPLRRVKVDPYLNQYRPSVTGRPNNCQNNGFTFHQKMMSYTDLYCSALLQIVTFSYQGCF